MQNVAFFYTKNDLDINTTHHHIRCKNVTHQIIHSRNYFQL